MKFAVVLMLMLLPLHLLAQHIEGVVLDKATNQPIAYPTVSDAKSIISTGSDGKFTLNGVYPGDTIRVSSIGYKPYKMGVDVSTPKIVIIYLQQTSILLRNVTVKAKHDVKADSLRTRKEFAKVFTYKSPTFMDMFVPIDPYVYKPNDYITATNSTTTLVSVNLLAVLSLLDKKKDPTSKLQQTLLKDEESDYVDRVFSKQKVTDITNLKGDSLLDFMDDYRPTLKQAKTMTDYDMMLYIKKDYAEFIRAYTDKKRSPFSK